MAERWERKHAPQQLSDFVGQTDIVATLQSYIQTGISHLPHLLFYGDFGLGKTAMAKALANEIGAVPVVYDSAKDRNREFMNNFVNKLKPERNAFAEFEEYDDGTPVVIEHTPIIYILDEFETVSSDNQILLRTPLEIALDGVRRVIIITNKLDNVNEGLRNSGRMKVLEFKKVSDIDLEVLGKRILQKESIDMPNTEFREAIRLSNGNARDFVSRLQEKAESLGKSVPDSHPETELEIFRRWMFTKWDDFVNHRLKQKDSEFISENVEYNSSAGSFKISRDGFNLFKEQMHQTIEAKPFADKFQFKYGTSTIKGRNDTVIRGNLIHKSE